MQMIHLWALKYDQNKFFETEASFILPLTEMTENSYLVVDDFKYEITEETKPTEQ